MWSSGSHVIADGGSYSYVNWKVFAEAIKWVQFEFWMFFILSASRDNSPSADTPRYYPPIIILQSTPIDKIWTKFLTFIYDIYMTLMYTAHIVNLSSVLKSDMKSTVYSENRPNYVGFGGVTDLNNKRI